LSAATSAEVTLVTGAGGGIGRGVALRLAQSGSTIVCTDVSLEAAEETCAVISGQGGSAYAHALDVMDPEVIESVIARIWAEHGTITRVVTAAGVIHIGPLVELDRRTWDRTMDVNLRGTFFTFQSVARRLLEAGSGGAFVAVASVAGRSGRPLAPDYAASKAGVLIIVKSLSMALAPSGIRVNAVCPGIVDTPMTRQIHEERAQLLGITQDESLRRLAETVPLGRLQSVDDVADVVEFLLSDNAAYVTGQAINACGGLEYN
jgi:NAD(P)-dependent dehydrogenase (short-subunit alcohol dehydrogenase family)